MGGRTVASLTLAGRLDFTHHAGHPAFWKCWASSFGQTLERLDSLEESSRLQQNLSGVFDTLTDFIFVLDGRSPSSLQPGSCQTLRLWT